MTTMYELTINNKEQIKTDSFELMITFYKAQEEINSWELKVNDGTFPLIGKGMNAGAEFKGCCEVYPLGRKKIENKF